MSYDIPRPTGPYPVASYDVLDKTGLDSSRFRVYYPTTEERRSTWLEWDELGRAAAPAMGNGFMARIMKCYLKDRKLPVWRNGPLRMPEKVSKIPVALISHGLMLSKDQQSYISYEIASYGFFVAALDHRDGSSCTSLYIDPNDGQQKYVPFDDNYDIKSSEIEEGRFKQMERRVKDLSDLMDCLEQLNRGELKNVLKSNDGLTQFAGKIDTQKCAVVGHSFGGATVVSSLSRDTRIKVGIALDAWMGVLEEKYLNPQLEKPILFINCVGHLKKSDVQKMLEVGSTDNRSMVTILGSNHLTHTDFAFFPKSRCLAKAIMKSITEPKLANDASSEIMMGFIGKFLDLPMLDGIASTHPDIVINGTNFDVNTQMCGKGSEI